MTSLSLPRVSDGDVGSSRIDAGGPSPPCSSTHCTTVFWLSAIQVIVLFSTGLTASVVGYALGAAGGAWPRWIALLMAAAATHQALAWKQARVARATRGYLSALATAWTLVTTFAATVVCERLMDFSWDGQWYHLEALLELARDWNPMVDAYPNPFVKHYPFGAWVLRRLLVDVTGNIESAKAVNWMLAVASFGMASRTAVEAFALPLGRALLFSVLLALAPNVVGQVMTFYVDGLLCSLLTCLVCAAVCFSKTGTWFDAVIALLVGVLAINTKFTGPLYVLAIVGPVAMVLFWFARRRALVLLGTLALTLSLGIGAVGYHPYVSNTLEHGDPFYPVNEGTLRDRCRETTRFRCYAAAADAFLDRNQLDRFVRSILAVSDSRPEEQPVVKLPFSVTWDEVRVAGYYDIRFGGYGPLYSGALLVGILMLSTRLKRTSGFAIAPVALAVLLFASGAAMPAGWWSRLAPQVWAVPVLCLAAIWMLGRSGTFLAAVLCANITCVIYSSASWTLRRQQQYDSDIEVLRTYGRSHVIMLRMRFPSTQYRLRSIGIDYVEAQRLGCTSPYPLEGLFAEACFEPRETLARRAAPAATPL